eukprot:CAMPEP_0114610172 /NCGR_PEP_ID=MMETSP0168-20121206/3461_1 /TAXON_ID=95228 ORGANISM="Vannella sp., Strain DIVA3 517/6/12" /NCGR_SAMPLE_ID=MMETSP0168 /ASSEMBLY_ACC=CAM_ASM_000044 /LENGTH=294 /DNA_ID=CAMNT_0001821101 /DNA_START=230 /DNA_END=1111 /DNA_ORIENTATION=+
MEHLDHSENSPWEAMSARVEFELVRTAALVEDGRLDRPAQAVGSYLHIWKQPIDASLEFLSLAVSAHLSRNCCTVVVGDDVRTVNRMIATLCFFSRGEDLHSVRLARPGLPYIPDVHLQGVIKPKGVGESRLVQSSMPSAVVDLSTKDVSWTAGRKVHEPLHRNWRMAELRRAVKSASKEVFKCTLTKARTSPIVRGVVQEVFALPPSLRACAAVQVERLLHHRAMMLISFLQAASLAGMDDVGRFRLLSAPERALVQRLRVELLLLDEVDWEVVLCAADRILPGVQCALAVDS